MYDDAKLVRGWIDVTGLVIKKWTPVIRAVDRFFTAMYDDTKLIVMGM